MCDIYPNISTIQKERNAIRASADKLTSSTLVYFSTNIQTHIFLDVLKSRIYEKIFPELMQLLFVFSIFFLSLEVEKVVCV